MPSESAAFNLVHARWLPVSHRSGAVTQVSPSGITTGIADDPIVAFAWPRPDFNGAALEFMIGLLSTAAAPENDGEWLRWWRNPPSQEELAARFLSVAQAFNLDGPGPRFLQDRGTLDGAEQKGIGSLLIDAPGAQTLRNNADLFVKRGGVPVLGRAAAAMALFTLSTYAPSGGAGHRTSLRGGGPMTTLIVAEHPILGDTLWSRLWSNIETLEQVASRAPSRSPQGNIFPWLEPTRTSNRKARGRDTTPADIHPLQVYWGMPRRIRLDFGSSNGPCGLTGARDTVSVASYRTRTYGTNYSEGFEHPLSPYYRQKVGAAKLPVHPNPGGVSYRLWPGLVVQSADNLRDPAATIRHWPMRLARGVDNTREIKLVAFGFDMDNMKARAWIESEMPLWRFGDQDDLAWREYFIQKVVAGATMIARLLVGAVKTALYERPKDAPGDYGFVAERLYRDTESSFHMALADALSAIKANADSDDPTYDARERWVRVLAKPVLALFDEYAPMERIEDRHMHRHVRARFNLAVALRGRGKVGRTLFERDLGIVSPATTRTQASQEESP